MNKYTIECIETYKTVVIIEAETEEDAEDAFERKYHALESDYETDFTSGEMKFYVSPWG